MAISRPFTNPFDYPELPAETSSQLQGAMANNMYAQPGSQTPAQPQGEYILPGSMMRPDDWLRAKEMYGVAHLRNEISLGLQNAMAASSAGTQGPFTEVVNPFRRRLTSAHLEHPMFIAPLSVIENLWATRFGDRWVKETELREIHEEDNNENFVVITKRLRNAGRLEEHMLSGSFGKEEIVYRLKD